MPICWAIKERQLHFRTYGYTVNQVQILQLLLCRQERRFEGIAGNLAQLVVAEAESVLGELVIAVKGRTKDRRIVRIQCHHDSSIEVGLHRMVCSSAAASGSQVTGDTNFERNLALHQFGH